MTGGIWMKVVETSVHIQHLSSPQLRDVFFCELLGGSSDCAKAEVFVRVLRVTVAQLYQVQNTTIAYIYIYNLGLQSSLLAGDGAPKTMASGSSTNQLALKVGKPAESMA